MSALVRSLSSVYPAMASKTGRLTTISTASTRTKAATYIREPFTTSLLLAVVGLFTGVSADMNCQCTPLNEALPTTLGHA